MYRSTKSQTHLALIAGLMLALGACGGEESKEQGEKLNSSDAKIVQKSTTGAVKTAVVDHLLGDLGALGQGDPMAMISGAGDAFDVDGAIPGDLGGSFGLAGSGKALGGLGDLTSGDLSDLPGFDLDLKGTFDKWKTPEGAVLDGIVDLEVNVSSVMPIKVTVRVKGLVDVTGAVAGKADIDLSINFGANGLPDVCGLVGGQGFDLDGCSAGQGGLPGTGGDLPGTGGDLPGTSDAFGAANVPQLGDALAAMLASIQTKLAADVAVAKAGLPQDIPGVPGGIPGAGDEIPAAADWLSGAFDSATVDGELPGALGGMVEVKGTGAIDADGATLNVKLTLTGFGVQSWVLAGTLDATIEVDAQGNVTASLQGALGLSGVAAGQDIDVDINVDLTGAAPSICGTIDSHPIAKGMCE